jgi:hypothetical protein
MYLARTLTARRQMAHRIPEVRNRRLETFELVANSFLGNVPRAARPALLSAHQLRQLGEVRRHCAGPCSLVSRFAPRWPNRHNLATILGRVKLRHRRHKKEPQAVYALGALLSLLPHFRLLSWAAGFGGWVPAQLGLMNGI